MKLVVARGPGRFGGIFRRFRELCEYCEGRHELLGVMPLAESDEPLDQPVRTLSYARAHVSRGIFRAESAGAVVQACEAIINRIARDLQQESPDKILAADTDLKGLCVIEACHRAGLAVTTFVAGLSSLEAEFDSRSSPFKFMPLVEQFCLERSDRLIFPSQFAAEYCAARFPGMAPYTVIRNGIADIFLKAPLPNPEPRRIGAVMRTSGIKNPDMLAAVAERLGERGFSIDLVTGSHRGAGLHSYPPSAFYRRRHALLRWQVSTEAAGDPLAVAFRSVGQCTDGSDCVGHTGRYHGSDGSARDI